MLSRPDFKEKQIILALLSHGDRMSFKNDNIIITDGDKKIKHQSTCYRVFSLFAVGHLTLTTGLLQRAKRFGFSIVFMNHNLKPYAFWNADAKGNVLLRKKQYEYDSRDIAGRLVHNKISSQIKVLQKIRNRGNKTNKVITDLKGYGKRLSMENLTFKEILGLEGMASKIYFQSLFGDFGWRARRPRTKMDPINCLLDIGYTLLFHFVEGLTHLYGFDVYQGVYHRAFYQRKSLVCDLVEPFRPLIDDSLKKAFRLKQIRSADFTVSRGQYMLFGKKSLPYMGLFISALMENKEAIFRYIQSYYRSFIGSRPIEQYPYFDIFKGGKAC